MKAPRVIYMEKQKRYTRKLFIQWMAGLILGFAAWIWYRITNFQSERESKIEFFHGQDIPLGISYYGRYYIFRTETTFHAFSTICTHAGCRIGKGDSKTLQCGCHGSQFDGETGRPLKGPAIKNLEELACRLDKKTEQWVVKIKPVK